ncbi:ropporin-1-like protein [Dysidea avara]|uniref:ropporin-1-like protein n=1 Tax=Dysidea avara TaxID=196820 RepID=UPI003331BA2B
MDPDTSPLYCVEQIKIPPLLPNILKDFTKAAIVTQPPDLLEWSAAYFKALAAGEVAPVKDRLDRNPPSNINDLSQGQLAMLHKQLKTIGTVKSPVLEAKWRETGFTKERLQELLSLGDFGEDIEWEKLLTLACSSLEHSLPQALRVLCEILTTDLEGGPARIPLEQFEKLYKFLAQVDGEVSPDQVNKVIDYLKTDPAPRFEGKVGPHDFLHPSCPKLDSN